MEVHPPGRTMSVGSLLRIAFEFSSRNWFITSARKQHRAAEQQDISTGCTGWSKTLCALDDNTSNTTHVFLASLLGLIWLLGNQPPGPGDTRLTLTPSVIHNSNYVIMVSDRNCLKYFCVFFTVIIRCTETFWSPCIIDPVWRNDRLIESVEVNLCVERLITHATLTLQDFVLFLRNFLSYFLFHQVLTLSSFPFNETCLITATLLLRLAHY
jgi:hypothetical protein